MYVKHFLKMLLGLILMAVIGVGGLVIANYYSKKTTGSTGSVIDTLNGR